MPKGKKPKPYRRKGGQERTTKKITGTMILVDCTRCGGGTNRCSLCRDTEGKVRVSR